MRYRAEELYYEQVKVFGKQALFSDMRILDDSVPEGFFRYEVRHNDECLGEPVQVAKGISKKDAFDRHRELFRCLF